MRTNIFDKNFTSLVRGKKKNIILSFQRGGDRSDQYTSYPSYHLPQPLPDGPTPSYNHTTCNPPCTAMGVWSRTTVGEDRTSDGDETPDVGTEPRAARTREWKWNVSHDDGWEH